MKSYEQKYFFEKRTFIIEKNGLVTRTKSTGDEFEDFIPFEKITNKTYTMKQTQYLFLYFGLLFSGLGFMFLFSEIREGLELTWQFFLFTTLPITFGIVFMSGYFKESVHMKLVECDDALIQFFYNGRNKAETDRFIEAISEARNNFFKEKYINDDETMSYDLYMRRLRWLMEEEIIDLEEYEFLKLQFIERRTLMYDASPEAKSELN